MKKLVLVLSIVLATGCASNQFTKNCMQVECTKEEIEQFKKENKGNRIAGGLTAIIGLVALFGG